MVFFFSPCLTPPIGICTQINLFSAHGHQTSKTSRRRRRRPHIFFFFIAFSTRHPIPLLGVNLDFHARAKIPNLHKWNRRQRILRPSSLSLINARHPGSTDTFRFDDLRLCCLHSPPPAEHNSNHVSRSNSGKRTHSLSTPLLVYHESRGIPSHTHTATLSK